MKINMQSKTKVKEATIGTHLFKNKKIGLKPTVFHRLSFKLEPFNSGLDYISQPEDTSIELDWYVLGIEDIEQLDGLNLSLSNYPESEASVYIGNAHNWCNVEECSISIKGTDSFMVKCSLMIEFENEGVAENERYEFETDLKFEV